MRIVISSGHGRHVAGAVGILDEVTEARKVVDRVAALLRSGGAEATVYHDNESKTQSTNVNGIVTFHNRQTRDLDVSVHFNAHSKTDAPRGTEVLYRTQKALAAKVSAAIARASGLIDRGAKERTNLGFLNNTIKPAILIEVCFVDSTADVKLYREHFEAICWAIADAINPGSTPKPETPETPTQIERPTTLRQGDKGEAVREAQRLLGGLALDGDFGPLTAARTRQFQSANGLLADAIIGPTTWGVC